MAHNPQWETDLNGVIKRGDDIKIDYQKYSKCYPFTNENLKDLTGKIDKSNINKALCVLSSGDHAFNLIYHGITNIDTFDTNCLTEYYALGFKKIAIQSLRYQQFLDFFFNDSIESQSIEKYVISCLPENYKSFWEGYNQYLLDSVDKCPSLFDSLLSKRGRANIFKLLGYFEDDMMKNNNYLTSEVDYKQLQRNLLNAQINFKEMNIKAIRRQKEKYDLIMLSNILQAMKKPTIGKTVDIAKKIYKHNLTENGEMIYLYSFYEQELIGKRGFILERSPMGRDVKYILDGNYAIGKKKYL